MDEPRRIFVAFFCSTHRSALFCVMKSTDPSETARYVESRKSIKTTHSAIPLIVKKKRSGCACRILNGYTPRLLLRETLLLQ
jgi:hypothetical protein